MSRPKTLHVGAGVLTRHRNGACTFACRHDGCHAYSEPRGWRAGVRLARQHDADHDATEARYVGTPWGIPAHELPRPTRRRRRLRRLAAAVAVLALAALAALAFAFTVPTLTGHAAPRPAPAAPSIAVVPTPTTTAAAAPGSEGYVPTPAGPPATDANGQWIPEPDQPPTSPSSSAGGDR